MFSPTRLLGFAAAVSLLLAGCGFGWELARFGPNLDAAGAHLEREVRRRIDDESARVRALGARVASTPQLIADATSSRDRLPALFAQLMDVGRADEGLASATVYVPVNPGGDDRVLAWTDGPGGVVSRDRLAGPAALFVARGSSGVRLVAVQPVELNGRRIGVVAAEAVLTPVTRTGAVIDTSYGPVTIIPPYAGAGEGQAAGDEFVIAGPTGAPLFEVQYPTGQLVADRAGFRRRVIAVALAPIAAAFLLLVDPILLCRRSKPLGPWLAWSTLAALIVLGVAAGAAAILLWIDVPSAARQAILAVGIACAVAILGGGLWWRPTRRLLPNLSPIRFAVEHAAAGLLLGATVIAVARLLARAIDITALETSPFVLFPFDLTRACSLAAMLAIELALSWAVASALAMVALRWRVTIRRSAAMAAVLFWLAPIIFFVIFGQRLATVPRVGSLVLATAIVMFAVAGGDLRRAYRRTTYSSRLVLGFAAIFAPMMAAYPLLAATEDAGTRNLIESHYAPTTATYPEQISEELAGVESEIDSAVPVLLSSLPQLSAVGSPADSHAAFEVWRDTSLSRSRVVSDVELYGTDRALVSRFALNLPEYGYRAATRPWPGTSCAWNVFPEVTRFGAEDRSVLHAERGLCDASGQILGAIVVHVAPNDYDALPFLAPATPREEMIETTARPPAPPRPTNLQVIVYGWSFQPLFASGNVAWPISDDIFARLYKDGGPFWMSLSAAGRTYHVYFSQNHDGIYALGYRTPTVFGHAERIAEIAALAALLFVLVELALTARAALLGRPAVPLRALFREIRTSFYRKLFLAFVSVAVIPVFVFALAFGTYMTSKFRDDVESEANGVVAVARRVFEDLTVTSERPGQTAPPLSDDMDDVMVWIREVINQDVDLFDGADLVATSQRELVDSGLLPTRTPAAVYRAIALDRLPTFVTEDRLGASPYLVAAAPVTALGRNVVLSVPLASRQGEIDREINDLDRGVLVGSVLVIVFAAGLGASAARRVSDPVARLTKATRQIAAGRLDVRIVASTADELRRLVDDFNTMTETLRRQRAELARANQLKAWNEMARQVAHEIKNPLTPIQLAAEHLQRVHEDRGRPLGAIFDQCLRTVLGQVRLLRQIASEFSNFAAEPTPHLEAVALGPLVEGIVESYRMGLAGRVVFDVHVPVETPEVWADRALVSRALTNLVENALQAMPSGGTLTIDGVVDDADHVTLRLADTGVGMDAPTLARAFEPYFSTKTGGSGLGLANAKRHLELQGGSLAIASEAGVGTTLTITLPVATPSRRAAPAAATIPVR